MGVLNLREVPDELMRELRAQAALEGSQFHSFCKELLSGALAQRRGLTGRHYYEPLEGHTAPVYGGIARTASPDTALPPGNAPRIEDVRFEPSEPPQEIEIT